ncbi:MAG: sn-glycerol-3-phosphate ABC transporter ATP-binding protein UgpC [Burkholderiales bacterium]|nr:sn-glycerol-3-phosphate ABC transporter ATP-binding protein UgpC [Burkholderiales bacterium]
MGAVSLRGVHKRFGAVEVIRGVDLEVRDGEFLVFVGPSGCGKSTLLRMIAGLEAITEGELLIDGRRANEVRPADRGAAMVFQSYALYPHMTVAENMGFALRMAGVPRPQREQQVQRAAELLRITELLGRYPKALSGGQRQRVAIGRAIVRKPQVFLFDEPLSNLDASLRVSMRIELSRLHAELGSTMIYVTHDQVEAMTMGSRIAVFNQGRIEQLGAPLDLYNQPANKFVAGFLGAPRINLIDKPAAGAAAAHRALWDALTANAPEGAGCVGLRAEHLRVAPAGQGIAARVELAEHLGDSSILYLRVDGVAEPLHARVGAGHAELAAGRTIGLVPDAAWGVVFDRDGKCLR